MSNDEFEYIVTLHKNDGSLHSITWVWATDEEDAKDRVYDGGKLLKRGWLDGEDVEPREKWLVEGCTYQQKLFGG